ncbi:MAG: 50S ribosomal protein L23 [Chloroflexi bacterium]|nr:50S ribosomal protein L23 [Chloroflexota bacterium]
MRVSTVNIMNMPAKPRRFGRYPSVKPGWKKAIVTLAAGDRITLFEGV